MSTPTVTSANGRWAVILEQTGTVENIAVWDGRTEWFPGDGYIAIEAPPEVEVGWSCIGGLFSPPPKPPLTNDATEAANRSELLRQQNVADQQITMISKRVDTLSYAADLGIATPEEAAELEDRKGQLIEWKAHAVYLGRVSKQEDWPLAVAWPDQPEIAIP